MGAVVQNNSDSRPASAILAGPPGEVEIRGSAIFGSAIVGSAPQHRFAEFPDMAPRLRRLDRIAPKQELWSISAACNLAAHLQGVNDARSVSPRQLVTRRAPCLRPCLRVPAAQASLLLSSERLRDPHPAGSRQESKVTPREHRRSGRPQGPSPAWKAPLALFPVGRACPMRPPLDISDPVTRRMGACCKTRRCSERGAGCCILAIRPPLLGRALDRL